MFVNSEKFFDVFVAVFYNFKRDAVCFDHITSLLGRFSDITIEGALRFEANLSIGVQAGVDLDLLGASLKLQGNGLFFSK
ncbi:MAG: hypothetical protein F9K23_04150 [Bacteroidetes bacterium]|nr:MAG: hypothetical protein F9K23_04150 [Bacteroidota bacterium]